MSVDRLSVTVPSRLGAAMRTLAKSRGQTVSTLVTSAIAEGRALCGYEVDDAARGVIQGRGYGEYFTHRTGHSIGVEVHGNGANMDNLGTHDERRVTPWTCFSIEPGVYLPEFGVRSEVNMFVGEGEARVTGAIQRELALG